MFEAGLFALVTTDPGCSALIATRLYPVQGVPDSPTFPYVTYQNIPSGNTEYAFDAAELDHSRIQFDIWGTQFLAGKTIMGALKTLLSGYQGTLSDGTRVLFTSRLNEMDNFDVDSRSYRSVCEYEFQIDET